MPAKTRRTASCYRTLKQNYEITVTVRGFVFAFSSVYGAELMLQRFQAPHTGSDGKSSQFGKLPMWLKDSKHRPMVIKALQKLIANPPAPPEPSAPERGRPGRRPPGLRYA